MIPPRDAKYPSPVTRHRTPITPRGYATMGVDAMVACHARVAQRIERHRPKVGVGGSSPSAGTNAFHIPANPSAFPQFSTV